MITNPFLGLLEIPGAPLVYDVASFPFVVLSMGVIKEVFTKEGIKSVLDVGSGTGNATLMLEREFQVTSVEPSPRMREWAKLKGVSSIDGIAQSLPVLPQYDAVMANFLLRHLKPEELEITLTQLSQHVRVGGLLVLTDLLLPLIGPSEGQRQFLGTWTLYNPLTLSEAVEKKGYNKVASYFLPLSMVLVFRKM